ncbi:MAG: cadherin-like domain-containing protein, partial [Bacteroidales bacterium]|nr:cadherin-like domain-containing protein [Bacteroidales bacterium]
MKTFTNTFYYFLIALVFLGSNLIAQNTSFSIDPILEISEGVFAPLRIAVDQQGTFYITDAFNKSVSKYDASGNFIGNIDAVALPVSVAVNNQGELYLGDEATGHIFRYDENLGAIEFYTGTEYPTSMEFSPDNVLYVSDSKLQQVVVIDLSGNVIQTIGSGTLDFPTGIAIDNNNKRILVGEHGGKGTGFSPVVKVWMFDFQGNLIQSFGSHGNGDGQFYRVQGLTVGKCGDYYVVDPYLARISIFDENGVYKSKFGDWGIQPGQLNIPMDVVFDSQERLLITSMNNGTLGLFSISDTLPCSNILTESAMICAGESTNIEIAFEGTAPWTYTYTNGVDTQAVTTSDNPYILTVSEAGLYEVIALSDANYTGTCFTGSGEVMVTPSAPTSEMTGDAVICTSETADISIAFTGSPPWSFTYTNNGGNSTSITTTNNPHILKVSEAGLYEVTGLIGGGCTGTSFTGSANITINPLPTATITDGNGQIFIGLGETADLTVAFTGSPPWEITYTVDDLNPITISNIIDNPYTLQVSEAGSYEISVVSDAYCTNTVTLGYPELVLFSPPVAIDDSVITQNFTFVEIDVIINDYDIDGEIDSATVNIIDYPLTGILAVHPDGSVTYTPGQESCGQEIFTYTVADNSGFISNLATVTITIIDTTPPVFTDVPDDITVSCKEVPEPAIVAAQDNCDFEVTISYLGETIDNSCDEGYYTITRTWIATDDSGNSATYSQIITVDTKFTAGCFSVHLVSLEYSESENITTFVWKLNSYECEKPLSYITFNMPDNIIALEPEDNSPYSYPENTHTYLVENPSGSVKKGNYSIKFSSFGSAEEELILSSPEIFVYSLPGEIIMNELIVNIKSEKNIYSLSIPTNGCACSYIFPEKSEKIIEDMKDYESFNVKAYP